MRKSKGLFKFPICLFIFVKSYGQSVNLFVGAKKKKVTSTGKKRRETNDKKVAKKKNGFKEDMEKDEKKSVGTYISIFILVRI